MAGGDRQAQLEKRRLAVLSFLGGSWVYSILSPCFGGCRAGGGLGAAVLARVLGFGSVVGRWVDSSSIWPDR